MMFLKRLYWRFTTKLYFARLREKNKDKSVQQVFTDYWRENHWGVVESRSGQGSTLSYTERLRREIPALIARNRFSSILDLPCGDFHWFSRVELPPGVRYVGADIVVEMVDALNRQYRGPSREFMVLDAISGQLPKVDVWICRDLIFHLPHDDVLKLIDNFIASEVDYLLITSHAGASIRNQDTFVGGFRLINLMNPPFSLPEPHERITDYVTPDPERYLHLYSRDALAAWRRGWHPM